MQTPSHLQLFSGGCDGSPRRTKNFTPLTGAAVRAALLISAWVNIKETDNIIGGSAQKPFGI